MSSLLQFRGETGRREVRLEFVLRAADAAWDAPPAEPVDCAECGRPHERIHVAWRMPRGMFGPWVVFAYNGETHAPDLSLPIAVERLPRDAVALTEAETCARWHS